MHMLQVQPLYTPMRFQRNLQMQRKDVVPQSPLGSLLIMPAQTVINTRSKSLIIFTLGQCDFRVTSLEALSERFSAYYRLTS